ncbi:hypothetical protein LTR97_007943 [Elasticomyces elasticus]|uniref:SMP-30/Gluconolactonase/LRE-like region domain-containing protein n=1 Tax=Elasticomyces elasticus TaxID=574655 RepID=A0AAN7W2G6_9PEZI|nr:hypothetical protein LTR97_007943 [Elasticomyces elasticus]
MTKSISSSSGGLACIALLAFASHCTAFPVASQHDAAIRTVYEFPNTTWVENLAIRPNGHILTTIIGLPEVWNVDPFSQTAELVYTFPEPANSVLGITETEPDVFAVVVGFFNPATISGLKGSYSIWSIDLREEHWGNGPHHHHQPPSNDTKAQVNKITDIPSAVFLNGLTTLPSSHGELILVGDSFQGVIYSVNLRTSAFAIVLDEPEFKPLPTALFLLGVNGIHVSAKGDYLYFVNSFQVPLLGRVPITDKGTASGPVEIVVSETDFLRNEGFQADDFALDAENTAWIAGNPSGYLLKITSDGNVTEVIGGNSTLIAGDTAAAFGRGRQSDVLYLVTNGGLAYTADGVVGGKVVAVNTKEL